MCGLQYATVIYVLLEISRVGITMQVAADDGLRFVPLGNFGCDDSVFEPGPGIEPDEVHEIRTQQ